MGIMGVKRRGPQVFRTCLNDVEDVLFCTLSRNQPQRSTPAGCGLPRGGPAPLAAGVAREQASLPDEALDGAVDGEGDGDRVAPLDPVPEVGCDIFCPP